MDSNYKIMESWFRLLNDKLDYVIGKLDSESTEDSIDAPLAPPPNIMPEKSQVNESNPLKLCQLKFTYLWLKNGRSFWTYLLYVGNRTASGFRWNGKKWVPFTINLSLIDSFVCYDSQEL